MYKLTESQKQWIASFALTDVFFWFLMAVGCLSSPDLCGVGFVFGIAEFYAPFGVMQYIIPSITQSLWLSITAISVTGFIGHIFFGWFVGRLLQKRRVAWYVSIPVSILFVILLSIVTLAILVKMGRIS